jgi:DNA-binding beta-propeller fold protein YncE
MKTMKKTDTLRRLRNIACALAALGTLFAISTPSASAAMPPEFFTQMPSDGTPGEGGGQLSGTLGIAADSATGHVYVADSNNKRISVFTAWGEFLRAWGWNVVASGPGNQPRNEIQELEVDAAGGTFSLQMTEINRPTCAFTETTAPIPFDASAAAVQASLEALCAFQPGDIAVSGPGGGPWTIAYEGTYSDRDIVMSPVNLALTGGAETATIDVIQEGANFEICVPAEGDVCQRGQGQSDGGGGGLNAGQLSTPTYLAVDSNGDVYVYDLRQGDTEPSQRVQKFDSDGHFLLMFGGGVNKTTGEDICTAASGDECGAGIPGTGPGEFSSGHPLSHPIAADPSGTIWVGDKNRIQRFEPSGAFKSEISTPEPGESGSIAVDPVSGDLYFDFLQGINTSENRPNVYRLDPESGEVLDLLAVGWPYSIASDAQGNVFVVDDLPGAIDPEAPFIRIFDSSGQELVGKEDEFVRQGRADRIIGLTTSTACNVPEPTFYAAILKPGETFVNAYGSMPDPSVCPAPLVPPAVATQFTRSVGTDAAVVQGQINPNFWPDTTYYVQFGTSPCSAGGCDQTRLHPGAKLTSKFTNSPVTTSGVVLPGLQPGTTYHYRFVAQSVGGGPVFGEEASFTTFPLPGGGKSDCLNQAFRSGRAGFLPDCRGYEMVSPVEKNGVDITALPSIYGLAAPAELNQSSSDGDSLSYSSQAAFGDAISAPFTSQYLASRDSASGWSSHGISPPRESSSVVEALEPRLDVQFKAFSEDLCRGWLINETEPLLAPKAVEGYLNLYGRTNCGTEGYETITAAKPTNATAEEYWPEIQGVSRDGSHVIFRANARLTNNAASITRYQLYEIVDGKVRLVSVLPDGNASKTESVAGAPARAQNQDASGRTGGVDHAVSDDGSRIFWTTGDSLNFAASLYVRIDPSPSAGDEETISVSAAPARFWTAAADGSKAIFTRDGGLYEFDVDAEAETEIAGGVLGVLGASDDASRIYFASTQALGGEGEAGRPNLYFYQAGNSGPPSFIGTLGDADIDDDRRISPVSSNPFWRHARVTPDGGVAAFMSTAPLTGYDNLDVATGQPDSEVYLYSAENDRLRCVSCNPTGSRPKGRAFPAQNAKVTRIASQIPAWANQFYASRVLSDDGSRLFFESFDALVPRDINGAQDVYVWQQAESRAACENEIGGELFLLQEGGCLSLISSGENTIDSQFVDASHDGGDVFFKTGASLVPQDPRLIDIYDARVGGGFPPPATTPAQCEGEACQPPPTPPNDPTPGSLSFSGAGNVKTTGTTGKCPKGKRKVRRGGKVRCVPKKPKPKQNSKQKRSHNRGAHR